jgi:hypothetical protein
VRPYVTGSNSDLKAADPDHPVAAYYHGSYSRSYDFREPARLNSSFLMVVPPHNQDHPIRHFYEVNWNSLVNQPSTTKRYTVGLMQAIFLYRQYN